MPPAENLEMPPRIAALPRDKHGRPVPWFVAWIDGQPDFRIVADGKIRDAHRFSLCWICGERRGRHVTFVIGPMCAVNRTSAEPPAHLDCAIYSARACPFLATPAMVRRENHKPENIVEPAGTMIRRNPGVALVWTTRTYKPFGFGSGGMLFEVGDPDEIRWYAEGRPATRDEILASFETGLPTLEAEAAAEGRRAVAVLERMAKRALELVPA